MSGSSRKQNLYLKWANPPFRALPRPDLNSLMRGWMMGEWATSGRWD